MSTDFTTVLSAPDRPLGELLTAIEAALVNRVGLQHDGTVLRCAWQPDTETFDEVWPVQQLGPAKHLSEHANAMAGWGGFAIELWNETMLLYVLVVRVARPAGTFVNVWVTLPTNTLERLVTRGELRAYCAALAEISAAVRATAGYGHFELAYEALAPEHAEQAIVDLPDYPGEPATIGILPVTRVSLAELDRDHGETFDIFGTTAGYWILTHRQLETWLGV